MQDNEQERRAAHYAKVAHATRPVPGQPAPAPQDATATQDALAKWLAGTGPDRPDEPTTLPAGAYSKARGQ
jgi:hypothetical protein